MWCWMMRMSWKYLFESDWKRWTEVFWVMLVFDVMLDDENELKIFIWKWLKEVNRSVMSNVRFWCWMMRMSWKYLFESDWKRWTEVLWVTFVFDVMLDDENELKIFVRKWLKEVNRSLVSNVRFWCDVGWWERVENICLKVIERGEQKSDE